MHLDIAAVEVLSYKPEDYFRTQQTWKAEVWEYNEKMRYWYPQSGYSVGLRLGYGTNYSAGYIP